VTGSAGGLSQALPAMGKAGEEKKASRKRGLVTWRTHAFGWSLLAPVVVLTAVFSLLPLSLVVWRSLYAGNVFGTNLTWAGLSNYSSAVRHGGAHSLAVTAVYTGGFVVIVMGLGLAFGILFSVRLKLARALRFIFVIPLVTPTVATALIWGSLFAPEFGFVNRIFGALGLGEPRWLSSPDLALVTVLLFGVWQFFGEAVLLYIAGLASVPREIVDAAEIDGANAFQRLRYVRLPLVRRTSELLVILTTLTGLQTFTQIFVLTNGGPGRATTTLLYDVYKTAFVANNVGKADALAVLLFVISFLITLGQLRLVRRGAT
jgi:ABC-type sugar transport system permease subunit